jgi:hypothetical protein
MSFLNVSAYLLFAFGGLICVYNFYTSFVRCYAFKILHKEYKWESGLPIIGSLLVGLSLFLLYKTNWLFVLGLILIAVDTGGIHWFLGTLFCRAILSKYSNSEN